MPQRKRSPNYSLRFGVVANHVVSTTVALYFHENRGLATGAATAGSTAGQLVLVPVLAACMNEPSG